MKMFYPPTASVSTSMSMHAPQQPADRSAARQTANALVDRSAASGLGAG